MNYYHVLVREEGSRFDATEFDALRRRAHKLADDFLAKGEMVVGGRRIATAKNIKIYRSEEKIDALKSSFALRNPIPASALLGTSARRRDPSSVSAPEALSLALDVTAATLAAREKSSPVKPPAAVRTTAGTRVFVVHGHDSHMKEATARVIEKAGLDPVILHERPNHGRTIIEKFEQFADVHYAVVLFSPDDEAVVAGNVVKRARQNVIFELGYFMAKLGRERVAVLHRGNVEILSDYQGVLWIPFDDHEGWKERLRSEFLDARLRATT